jgi:hypothetical protein
MRKTSQLAVGLLLFVSCAAASTVSFSTPLGATEASGAPENSTATVTTGNNTITVTLSNQFANPESAKQLLTGFEMTLSQLLTTNINLGSVNGTLINIDSTTRLATVDTVDSITHWTVSSSLSNLTSKVSLTALGSGQPRNGIIGPAGTDGTYSAANSSLLGSTHEPLISQTATFTINAPGVTAATSVTAATFYFNTAPGDGITTNISATPEPGTITLLAAGILMLGVAAIRPGSARKSKAS